MRTDRPLRFGKRDFQKILTARVNDYFSEAGQGKRDAVEFYIKAGFFLVWLIASYAFLVFAQVQIWQALALTISLAVALTTVAFNIFHDAGHNAISRHALVNWLACLGMNFIGASSYIWVQRHNTVHHAYPNIHEYDGDIDIGVLADYCAASALSTNA